MTLLVSHMIVEESWLTLLHKDPSVHQGLLAFFSAQPSEGPNTAFQLG